jgi:hypothetical protein
MGKRGERRKIGGNAVRVRSSRSSICYTMSAKVCISVNFPNHPRGERRKEEVKKSIL